MSEINHAEAARLAGIRLIGVDDDTRRLVTCLDEGRIDIAKALAASIISQVEKTQETLRDSK